MASPTPRIYRSALLNPQGPDHWDFIPDGACAVRDGRIVAMGHARDVVRLYGSPVETEDLEGVLVPGFADLHCHWVQHAVQGRYAGELLDWLEQHIWTEEARYLDPGVARPAVQDFYRNTLRAGTVMGMSFSSVHAGALHAAMEEMRGDWIVGNVLMPCNAPRELREYSLHAEEALQGLVSGLDRNRYAVTPRFAPNMDPLWLQVAARIASRNHLPVQTHLAESRAEVAWVRKMYPGAGSYTEVYDRAGLVGRRSVLAHCIEMGRSEWKCLAERQAWVAHCPSSNEALGNGRMPLETLREYRIPFALGSDIGAGPSHSMLHVMQRFLAVHRAAGIPVQPEEALFRATAAGAQAMGRGAVAGSLHPGKRADFVLLPGSPREEREIRGWFGEVVAGSPGELENRPLGTWLGGMRTAPAVGGGCPEPGPQTGGTR